ncbi:MAG: PilZ domain-containing protein [Desulfobacterales bacterium]
MDNKRRFTRVPFRAQTRIDIGGRTYAVGEIYNLAIGGCLLHFGTNAKIGTPCRLTIRLSESDEDISVHVKGEVVRSDSGMLAVKFIQIDPDSLFHLRNIIRYNARDAHKVEKEIETHPGIL